MAPTLELLDSARRLRVRGAPVRRRLDRRARRRRSPTRCSPPAGAPTPSCWRPSAARSGTRTDPAQPRPEQGLLGLRKGLGLYANLRPVKPLPALYDASPLRRERIEGTDLLVVRELTGGIYFGEKTRTADLAPATSAPTPPRRSSGSRASPSGAARCAKVTSVDKANVLETSRLWREVVSELHAREFPHVELEHVLVDNAAMQLVSAPRHFDVILTENMFGDILSDEAAMLTGSIGMLPSASLGRPTAPGPVRAGARLGARHRRAGASPIRWRCSCRRR